jgi:CBS domain containing-hemolysin-like protein
MGMQAADESSEAHSEEEIKLIIDASQKGGVIDDTESEIIQNAISFSEIFAHEIMIPRQDMVCIYQNSTFNEIMELVKQNKHTRFPLCNGDKDQILGMIHIRDLFECKSTQHKDILNKIVRKILFVPENKSISEILHEMMKKRIHMAVVVDEYGGTAGIVTLEDIVEAIVGNIQDEYDNEDEEFSRINETTFTIEGITNIDEIDELTGKKLPEGDYDTVAGFIISELGYLPKDGEMNEVMFENLKFTVLAVDNRRIGKIRVEILPEEEKEQDEDYDEEPGFRHRKEKQKE